MKSFVYSELREVLIDKSQVAYCYEGRENRGSIAFMQENGQIVVINSSGHFFEYIKMLDLVSNFELWAFIEDMDLEKDKDTRQEAVNQLFEVYCIYYNYISILREFPFTVF